MNFANGMPNHTDFIQSRMNPSNKFSNTKPWEEIRVSPGLNKDYNENGTGGFNAGMEAREAWMPKTVDNLRVKTNPKISFGGVVLGGSSAVQNLGVHGKIEKNRVDRDFELGPERYFTTTGAYTKNTSRENFYVGPQNRDVNQEYYGAHNGEKASYTKPAYETPKKSEGNNKYLGPPTIPGLGKYNKKDFGRDSYSNLPNSRNLTCENSTMGNIERGFRAAMLPIFDVLKPTAKENVIGNARGPGNVSGINTYPVHNPRDQPRTTIRQQTTDTKHIMLGGTSGQGGHFIANYQPNHTQRATTSTEYTPAPSAIAGTTFARAYNAEYNHRPHTRKEPTLAGREPAGNGKLMGNTQNITSRRTKVYNPSTHAQVNMPKTVMGAANYPKLSGTNRREVTIQGERITPDLLSPFQENPYTHSITFS